MLSIRAIAEGLLCAIFAGGVFVWFYNRYLADLRESTVKKLAALATIPGAIAAGAGHAVAVGLDWPRSMIPVWLGLAFLGFRLRQVWIQQRENEGLTARRVRLSSDAMNWRRYSAPVRLALRLIQPINGAGDVRWARREVPVEGLHRDLDGLRIVFLTDFHVHPTLRMSYFREVVDAALDSRPDVLLIGGDFLSKDRWRRLPAEALARIAEHPNVYAVRGNHDFWTRPALFGELARRWGARLLSNEVGVIERGEGRVALLGLEHPYIPLTDRWAEELRAGLDALGAVPRLGLVHTPQAFPEAAALGCTLCLAGHTHGGQIRLPLLGTTIAGCDIPYGHTSGCGRLGAMRTLVSNGIGAFFPLRFLCPPHIVEIVLRSGG